ncbi:hypothetical protein ACQZ61_04040 [Agrobacterium vitis]|uniref:hypothetical protein n=1 Tax=Agrobacterium vitis TaxID=373 RepID=UPI001F3560D9|nr:hypothetical protein [Agrobacterium vitis]MCF1452306.1 hypothetical protein [Agrobacterium vitis]
MMFASLSDLIKIPLAVLFGIVIAVIFYEGVKVPFLGWQLVDGRVASQVKAATADLVAASDLAAAKADLAKLQTDIARAEALRQIAERNIQSLMQQDDDDAKALAERQAADDGADGARYTAADIERMSKRSRRAR